jgi:predicted small lipoprotein YifL
MITGSGGFDVPTQRLLIRIAAFGGLIAALGLAGCGRKSGLDLPPASVAEHNVAQPGTDPGALRDGRPVAPQGPKRRTPLDWLVD